MNWFGNFNQWKLAHGLKRPTPADRARSAYQAEVNAKSTKRRQNAFERSIKAKDPA